VRAGGGLGRGRGLVGAWNLWGEGLDGIGVEPGVGVEVSRGRG